MTTATKKLNEITTPATIEATTPKLTRAAWQIELNLILPHVKRGGFNFQKITNLHQRTVEAFGPDDWTAMFTMAIIAMTVTGNDPNWLTQPLMPELLAAMNPPGTDMGEAPPVVCSKCGRDIAGTSFKDVNYSIYCDNCVTRLNVFDRQAAITRHLW